MDITVIIPVYNEEDNINMLYERLTSVLTQLTQLGRYLTSARVSDASTSRWYLKAAAGMRSASLSLSVSVMALTSSLRRKSLQSDLHITEKATTKNESVAHALQHCYFDDATVLVVHHADVTFENVGLFRKRLPGAQLYYAVKANR